jgi:hypothetical protein
MTKLIFSEESESITINIAKDVCCSICEEDGEGFENAETDNGICLNCVKQLATFIKLTNKVKK